MPENAKREARRQHQDQYTVYDRALISAKLEGRTVDFTMADGTLVRDCLILSVDRFAVEVGFVDLSKCWVHKGFIQATTISQL